MEERAKNKTSFPSTLLYSLELGVVALWTALQSDYILIAGKLGII